MLSGFLLSLNVTLIAVILFLYHLQNLVGKASHSLYHMVIPSLVTL